MDSFYDAPRRPPVSIARETLATVPVVPEISVLCPSNAPRNAFTPYNQWRRQQNTVEHNLVGFNKENINSYLPNPQNNSMLRKQVRFESPVLQQKLFENKKLDHDENLRKAHNNTNQDIVPRLDNKGIPSFEQMYLANIPNRQLDLSVIDLPKRAPENNIKNEALDNCNSHPQAKEKDTPRTYKEFLKAQKNLNNVVLNDSVKDIFNYKGDGVDRNCLSPNMQSNSYMRTVSKVEDHVKGLNIDQNNITNMNDVPLNTENYFQSVSQAISRRSMNSPMQSSKVFQTETHNLKNLKHSPAYVRDQVQKPKIDSYDFSLQNKLFTSGPQDCAKNANDNMEPDLHAHSTLSQKYIENFHGENKPNRNENHQNLSRPSEVDLYRQNCMELERAHKNAPLAYTSESQKRCNCSTEISNSLKKTDDDLSAKDLLKIIAQQSQQIAQQNNQLLLLQQQVSGLVSMQTNRHNGTGIGVGCRHEKYSSSTEGDNCRNQVPENNVLDKYGLGQNSEGCMGNRNVEYIQERCITSTQHEIAHQAEPKFLGTPKKNKNNLPNFSIGLTTSFEVSFRRPNHRNQNEFLQKNTKLLDFEPEPPRIQEITETESTRSDGNYKNDPKFFDEFSNKFENDNDNKETLVDTSMVFREPIKVRESCPSPEPSIKIDMKDFDDSESDDDSSHVQASLYRNLMAQVNKILQQAQIETTEDLTLNMAGTNLNHKTMHKVKEATLKHLKRIGVDLSNFEQSSQNTSSSDETNGRSYDQDDISFAVKQLLMKYLPADHLAKLAAKEGQHGDEVIVPSREQIGAIKNRPEFSFATVQYMKKYNLFANSPKDFNQPRRQNPSRSPKILDITKLKQQPKLL